MKLRTHTLSLIPLLLLALPAAAQEESVTRCDTHPLVPQRVKVVFPTLPSDASSTTLSIPLLPAELVSSSDDSVTYEVVGEMVAAGVRSELVLATGNLIAGETLPLFVPLDAFGIDISNLQFSGRLSLELRVLDAAGTLLDRDTAPPVFFHETPGAGGGPAIIHVYRSEARRTSFNGGDLYQLLFTAPPADLLGAFEGGSGRGLPSEDHGPLASSAGGNGPNKITAQPQAAAAGTWQFCLRWLYDSIDSGFGEDYYTSGRLMSARGARIEIDHPNWAQPKSFYANEHTGCVEFNEPENSGFIVKIWAETRLGDNDNIFIRAYPTKAAAQQNPQDPPYWQFTADPYGVPRTVYYQNESSPISNLIAFSSFVFYRVDSQCSPGLPGPENLRVVNDNPNCSNGSSCQSANYVQITANATNRKFLIGHEVGHWIHYQWTDTDPGYVEDVYGHPENDFFCEFEGVGDHAMRSKEYAVGAFFEGLAHFLSALAWNSSASTSAWFKYYKDLSSYPAYDDFEFDEWRLDIEGLGLDPMGGTSNWMSNMCTFDAGVSVEMDWLRFYWDYLTNAGAPKPTIRDILRHVQFTREAHEWSVFGVGMAYNKHLLAIQDLALGQTQFEGRFVFLAESNGIAQ